MKALQLMGRSLPLAAVAMLATAAVAAAQLGTAPEDRTTSLRTVAATPIALSSAEIASPALTSSGTGRSDLFFRSSSAGLVQQYLLSGGSWRRELPRGGTLKSQPAVVSWGPGRLDVFARGGDDALWHRYSRDGVWSAWESLGGALTSAPTVASWEPGRLDVFARSGDNALFQKTFAAGAWSGWSNLGGILASSPSAVSPAPGQIAVAVRGRDNGGWYRSFSGGAWSSWAGLGGGLSSQPAIASPGPGQVDVFVRGTGQLGMYVKSQVGGVWGTWARIGTDAFSSGPSATAVGDDVSFVARKSNGYYYRGTRTAPGGAWSSLRIVDQFIASRRLATWVDTLDYAALTPSTAVPDMAARGVKTLFLSTGRFNSASDFFDEAEMADWLDRAHAAGIRVVGWYVPAYGDMTRDVRRVVAINNYLSPGGQRFDGLGVDIERFGTGGEVTRTTFNARAIPHLQQVRGQTSLPMVAIVPAPFTTDPGNNWEGFPWSGIGPNSEVVVPMALWSLRSHFTSTQVGTYVRDQIDRTQALTGRRVHVEGGVFTEGTTTFDTAHLQAFVNATKSAGAIGGSNYDYNTFNGVSSTTRTTWWGVLAGLNTL